MQVRNVPMKKSGSPKDWTRERVERLSTQEMKALRANAERLGESALADLCAELIKEARSTGGKAAAARAPKRRLISRAKAFEARGVWLQDPRTSWSGVRKADGRVVMTIWGAAVESEDGGCTCLLWRPNVEGARPWSDTAAGRERLEHCKLALGAGADGLLVYGESLDGHLPEDKARTIHGVDPETMVSFQVEKRGAEYWAVWGRKPEAAEA
jgi:hypothetical protein